MPVAVPRSLPDAVARRPLMEVAPTRALLSFPDHGRILVRPDAPAQCEAEAGRSPADLAFLDDIADALGRLLAGQFPVRASLVADDDGAIVVTARGVAGRSTVAAACWRRGFEFLADSVVSVDVADGVAVANGRAGGPVLWPDVVRNLGLDPHDGEVVRPGLAALRFPVAADPGPRPIRAFVVLVQEDSASATRVVQGFEALDAVMTSLWHDFAVGALDRLGAWFATAATLVRQAAVLSVPIPRRGGDPAAVVDTILGALGEPGPIGEGTGTAG